MAALVSLLLLAASDGAAGPAPRCDFPADVALVLDSSGSEGTEWGTVKSFAQAVVDAFNVGPMRVHMTIVEFSTAAHVVVALNDSRAALVQGIRGMPFLGQTTAVGRGLASALDELTSSRLARRNASKITILMSDGQNNVPPEPCFPACAGTPPEVCPCASGPAHDLQAWDLGA